MLSFEYRRNDVKLRRKKEKLSKELNNFKKEELQIDIDECEYIKKSTEQTAHHRVREIEHWSRIKKELDEKIYPIPVTVLTTILTPVFLAIFGVMTPGLVSNKCITSGFISAKIFDN